MLKPIDPKKYLLKWYALEIPKGIEKLQRRVFGFLIFWQTQVITYTWPTIFTRPVILHFYAANSRMKVKKHCKGLDMVKWADKETTLSNKQ